MELSEYVSVLRQELASISEVAGEDAVRATELIARALEPSVRLTLLEVLAAAAAEITSRLDDTAVEVRLARGEPSFVIQHAAPAPAGGQAPPAETEDASAARVTLRLTENLKSRIDAAAAADGVSVNTWLVHAARQALAGPGGRPPAVFHRGPGQRITGFAQS